MGDTAVKEQNLCPAKPASWNGIQNFLASIPLLWIKIHCIYFILLQVLKVFLHLRIKEVELQKDSEDIAPKKKFMTYKEKRKNLSRMQRKV